MFIYFSVSRNLGWDNGSCGDLLDPGFVKMLTPSSHFVGNQDPFSGSIHTAAGPLGAINRSKYAMSFVNANIKVLIEVNGQLEWL